MLRDLQLRADRAQSGEVPTAVRRSLRGRPINLEQDPIESDRTMLWVSVSGLLCNSGNVCAEWVE
jgi:hypothetical protein